MSSTASHRLANVLKRDTSSFTFPLAACAGARQPPRMAAPSHAPLRFTVLAALLSLLPACTRKLDVAVDVFIVTKAGGSVKLGLVEVRAIPLEAAEKALNPIITKRETESKTYLAAQATFEADQAKLRADFEAAQTKLQADLKAAQAKLQSDLKAAQAKLQTDPNAIAARLAKSRLSASKALQNFKHAINKAAASGGRGIFSGYQSDLDSIDFNLNRPERCSVISYIMRDRPEQVEVISCGEQLKAAANEYNAILTGRLQEWEHLDEDLKLLDERLRIDEEVLRSDLKKNLAKLLIPKEPIQGTEEFFTALPPSALSSKTNADGHCTFHLPSADWLLAATASRQLPDGSYEQYIWILKAPKDGHIMLSNDNTLRPGLSPFRN